MRDFTPVEPRDCVSVVDPVFRTLDEARFKLDLTGMPTHGPNLSQVGNLQLCVEVQPRRMDAMFPGKCLHL